MNLLDRKKALAKKVVSKPIDVTKHAEGVMQNIPKFLKRKIK